MLLQHFMLITAKAQRDKNDKPNIVPKLALGLSIDPLAQLGPRMVVKASMSSVLPSWVSSSQMRFTTVRLRFNDGRSRGVGLFKPGERAAKIPKLVESGC